MTENIDPLLIILKSLQSAADREQGGTTKYTWTALNAIGRNYGLPELDYDEFSAQYDSDEDLQSVIDNFDRNGIFLRLPNQESDGPSSMNTNNGPSQIGKMARNALPKEFK